MGDNFDAFILNEIDHGCNGGAAVQKDAVAIMHKAGSQPGNGGFILHMLGELFAGDKRGGVARHSPVYTRGARAHAHHKALCVQPLEVAAHRGLRNAKLGRDFFQGYRVLITQLVQDIAGAFCRYHLDLSPAVHARRNKQNIANAKDAFCPALFIAYRNILQNTSDFHATAGEMTGTRPARHGRRGVKESKTICKPALV